MTSLPASTLGIADRGTLRPGALADVVLFDPETIGAPATYEKPMQYATGVAHVWVNGVQVLRDGEHNGSEARTRSTASAVSGARADRRFGQLCASFSLWITAATPIRPADMAA